MDGQGIYSPQYIQLIIPLILFNPSLLIIYFYFLMNLQYPLNDNYHAYKHIEILKLKEKHKIVIIGYTSSENDYSALLITKQKINEPLKALSQIMQEVGPYPNYPDLKQKLREKLGEYHCKEVIFGYGIVGFHRFLQGYYLTYVSEMEGIAMIGRHKVNEIIKTEILPLFDIRNENKDKQNKYKEILSEYKLENYYYSYTYDMTHSLAKNMVRNAKPFYPDDWKEQQKPSFYSDDPNINNICELFHFNYGISRELSQAVKNQKWVMALVHGFCRQINVKLKGTNFTIVVIARRCRHHAGTRYIKRGIDPDGFVANYVQVQQIVINFSISQDTRPVCSSFIQMRGSVPTYWMQRPSIAIPKPSIEIRTDDYLYLATQKHFHDLIGRYGQHVYGINLMKGRQKTIRESGLSKEYLTAIQFINKNNLAQEHSLHYAQVDMKYHLKLDKNLFINKVRSFAYFTIQKTGIFLCLSIDRSTNDQYVEFQNGVIRANCVDCLDRTNSFQQLVGQTVLSVQMSRLMKEQTKFDKLELNETILSEYSELYERMGDLISIQYGSSYAHKQKIQKTTEQRNEVWTSIKRHFNNNLKDYDRQQQIDVFLGYRPDSSGPQIWQVKPSIEHFPSKRVNEYQHFQNYFETAFSYFKNQYCLDLFYSINNKEKFEKSKISHVQNFGREELKTKFTPEVVNSLVNEAERSYYFKFCLTPKMILEKKVWAQINPKSKQVETLQEKLSKPYNKMEFLNHDDKEVKIFQLNNKKYVRDDSPTGKKANGNRLKNVTFFTMDDDDLKDCFHEYLQNIGSLDDEELNLIEGYLKNDLVKDEQIEEQLNSWQQELKQNSETDDGFNKIRQIAEEEIKIIQNDYNNQNYLGLYQKKKVQVSPNTKKVQSDENKKLKKGVIKDNRVLMLEKIMKKNFTHGKIANEIREI